MGVGAVYPGYMSYKCIKHGDKEELVRARVAAHLIVLKHSITDALVGILECIFFFCWSRELSRHLCILVDSTFKEFHYSYDGIGSQCTIL